MNSPGSKLEPLTIRTLALAYLGLLVVLPLGALVVEALGGGGPKLLATLSDPIARHALGLSFSTAFVMVLINAVMGTATAWVLVRHRLAGKGLINALIDLPFAVPTVVTGVMLVALYGPSSSVGVVMGKFGLDVIYREPGIILALLFVSSPFVVRSVQPVLMEQDLAEEEAAATLGASRWTIFRRVTLPTIWPAIISGSALSLSRALGEFGSVVMVAGNRPMATRTAPIHIFAEIEGGRRLDALIVSAALLLCSLSILVALHVLQRRRGAPHGI
jgi:sulfate transport system permease protein